MVAHELHHLRGEFLSFFRAVANAQAVHHVAQAHDAEPDAPGAQRRLAQLRHRGDVLVGVDDIVQEARRNDDSLAQFLPVDLC